MRWLLQKLMTEITRAPRYRVRAGKDFQWSRTSWVHNAFRVYELLFGRRFGIRAESAAWPDGKGGTVQVCYTWEATLALMEARLRKFSLPMPKLYKLPVPQLITPWGEVVPSPYRFAIAFDIANNGIYEADDSITFDVGTTGSNLAMFVSIRNTGGASGLSATCTVGGNAATLIHIFQADGAGNVLGCFYRLGEAAGTTTVVINADPDSGNMDGNAASYSGVGSFEATSGSGSGYTVDSESGTTLTHTHATVADNAWVVMTSIKEGADHTAGTNTTRRAINANNTAIFDRGAATSPAGTETLETTTGSSLAFDGILTSFAPAGGAAAAAVDDFTTVTFFN